MNHPEMKLTMLVNVSDYQAFGRSCPIVVQTAITAMADTGAQSCLWSMTVFLAAGFTTSDLIPVSLDLVAANAVTQQPPTRSTKRHGSLNAGDLAQTADSIDSCSCPPRTVVPVRPVALPFECTPANNAKIEEWLLHHFESSTFNTSPHRPLPCMTGPPVEIYLEDCVIPERCTTQPQCRYTDKSRCYPTSSEMRPSGSSKGSPTVSQCLGATAW